ncbi:hypothetical protein BASA81_002388 [Batrachochytrium salamandrivorans]|nr:hypothetical protein BASA81_002388 [Batrachochytrium salamandrivorans]
MASHAPTTATATETNVLWLFGVVAGLAGLSWGLQGGEFAPVMDCDETFNYLEAAHYSLHGTGMQTWEYAPQYGLRSWFYVELHLVPIRLARLVLGEGLTKAQELLVLRGVLVGLSSWFEAMLASAVGSKFQSPAAAWLTAVVLGTSAGMGHARRSMLPSSTCMMCFTLAQALWMRNRPQAALLVGSFSVLVSWPFAALPYIPIGLEVLFDKEAGGVRVIVQIVILALVLFALLPGVVDSYFYGKPTFAALQMVLYNALGASGGGAHLYGVEPWTFYFKNLFLNFNLVLPVSLAATCMLPVLGNTHVRVYHSLGFLLAFGLFQSMPHKEERFLFQLYPTLCWSAVVAVAPHRRLATVFALVVVAMSTSRNLALGRLTAPNEVYAALPLSDASGALCLGREWHRFPSSFYLPPRVTLHWVQSDFKGILPQPFASKPEQGYARLVPHMNDLNLEEPSRYSGPDLCRYTVDVDLPYSERDKLQPFAATAEWKRVQCHEFVGDAKQPFRSFALPASAWFGVTTIDYCLLEKRTA